MTIQEPVLAAPPEPGETPEKLYRIAVHEAGHATVALDLGRRIEYVTMRREGDLRAQVKLAPHPAWFDPDLITDRRSRRYVVREIAIRLGGWCGEVVALGNASHDPANFKADVEQIEDWSMRRCGDKEEARAMTLLLRLRTTKLLRHPVCLAVAKRIVDELLATEVVSGLRAKDIYQQCLSEYVAALIDPEEPQERPVALRGGPQQLARAVD